METLKMLWYITVLFLLTTAEISSQPSDHCMQFPRELCPSNDCHIVTDDGLLCCNILSSYYLKQQTSKYGPKIKTLHVWNASINELEIGFFKHLQLESLSIIDSTLQQLSGQFPSELRCLNLSGNAITRIDSTAFQNLHNLTYLDLSHNNITHLPVLNNTVNNFKLDISGNGELECNRVKKVLLLGNVMIQNKDKTYCTFPSSFNWFNTTEKINFEGFEKWDKVLEDCPQSTTYKCTCKTVRVNFKEKVKVAIAVDCSNQNLNVLPKLIPNNTVILNISSNYITTLAPLAEEACYQEVRILYANNNNISSILDLEGSQFIKSFDILSLKNNHLKILPTYMLSNAFQWFAPGNGHLYLAYNRLHCDCNTAQAVKLWLVSYQENVKDTDKILCETTGEKVIDLDQNKMCVYKLSWTDYINYIIVGEVILLLILFSKVTYDYYVFKSSGYLPWPASKMPKMPCDWVFET